MMNSLFFLLPAASTEIIRLSPMRFAWYIHNTIADQDSGNRTEYVSLEFAVRPLFNLGQIMCVILPLSEAAHLWFTESVTSLPIMNLPVPKKGLQYSRFLGEFDGGPASGQFIRSAIARDIIVSRNTNVVCIISLRPYSPEP